MRTFVVMSILGEVFTQAANAVVVAILLGWAVLYSSAQEVQPPIQPPTLLTIEELIRESELETLSKGSLFPDPSTLSFVERAESSAVAPKDKKSSEDLKWLALAVYFEGRNQSLEGQERIAQVILNRVRNRYHPNTIKKVVAEGEHLRNRCQFSFMCDGVKEVVTEVYAWKTAVKVATVTYQQWVQGTNFGCALYYRADYTTSEKALKWFASLRELGKHGTHIFYCDPKA